MVCVIVSRGGRKLCKLARTGEQPRLGFEWAAAVPWAAPTRNLMVQRIDNGIRGSASLLRWERFTIRLFGAVLQVCRWRALLRRLGRLRRLQRLFAYAGHHLRLSCAGAWLRARLRVIYHSGSPQALRDAQRAFGQASPRW